MKFKKETEVLKEITQKISGNEPFMSFPNPWMIVNFSNHPHGSHNFFEGRLGSRLWFAHGDSLVFQVQRVRLVPMTRWERVVAWIKERV